MGTVSLNDLYSASGASAPSPGAPAPSAPASASGPAPAGSSSATGPAFAWFAALAVLVAIRLLYELAD